MQTLDDPPHFKIQLFLVLFFYLCSNLFKSVHGAISPSLMVLSHYGRYQKLPFTGSSYQHRREVLIEEVLTEISKPIQSNSTQFTYRLQHLQRSPLRTTDYLWECRSVSQVIVFTTLLTKPNLQIQSDTLRFTQPHKSSRACLGHHLRHVWGII